MRVTSYAGCVRVWIGVVYSLGLLGGCASKDGKPAESLSGTLYLEKAQRLALYWEDGEFELWDTERGRRLGPVQRLPREVGWCSASPDAGTILTADLMPTLRDADIPLRKGFIPSIAIWDAKSGKRKHSVRVPEAVGPSWYIHEWYGQWLDDYRVLIVRCLRENPSRAACQLRLIIIDTAAGKVTKASEELEYAGEHLFLSPDRTMALLKDDNYYRRNKGREGAEGMRRNLYAHTHVIDLESLRVVFAWPEPPDSPGGEQRVALLACWCPDSAKVITVSSGWADDHPAPKGRLWDIVPGRLLQTFSGHQHEILDIALTSTGDKLLTASEDRTLRVWATGTGKLEAVLSGHSAGLNKVVVLPGDRLAVSAAEESIAKVWDLITGKLKFDLAGHDSAVRDLEVMSDKVVRTITLKGTATTWSCLSGKRLQVTPKPPDFPKHFGNCELVEEDGKVQMRVRTEK